MSTLTQYDKNPFGEGAAARVSRSAATPTIATDTFTGWPLQGTKSHKLVATGTGAGTVGLPNADRPAAAAGDIWSASCTIRNSAAGSRTIQLLIVFYDTAGATLGTALATATTSATFTAAEVKTLTVTSLAAPASTASVDVQVSRASGGGAATSDPVHFERVTLTKTAVAIASKDPAFDVFAVWTSTADASTQTYYTPEVVTSVVLSEDPAPRVLVYVNDLPPGVATLTLFRTSGTRTFKVRGAVGQPVAGAFQIPDVEANGLVSYRAQMFTAGGLDLGYTATVQATITLADCWVHNPLDPAGAVKINIDEGSGRELTRPTDGEFFHPEGRTLAVLVSGRRRGLEGVDMYFSTDDAATAEQFEALFGGYNDDDQQIPVMCVRTVDGFSDLPLTFYAGFLKLTKKPINRHMGGNLREWEGSANETAPPAVALVVALLTRNDIDYFFASRNALDAAYSTRTAIDRDYSKAGTAP